MATDQQSPLALQLAARVEKVNPPGVSAICAAAALATITLLDDERSGPGGVWFDEVEAWNGARIRKIVRRGRGSAWERAQEPDGVTVTRDGAEVRAFVPGPLDQAPKALAKLQIQSSELEPAPQDEVVPDGDGLVIAITPDVTMTWGKRAAQCAHAAQRAWMRADQDVVDAWDAAGRPITIVHPTPTLWASLHPIASVRIHDGGHTEIPAGTNTTIAYWSGLGAEAPTDRASGAEAPERRPGLIRRLLSRDA
jgi:peptidyl-tRNA hydrolase